MSSFGTYTLTYSEQKRVASVKELAAPGASNIAELVGMLADPSWVVRRAVVGALASVGSPAVGPLCEVLRNQRENEARIAAAVDALVASRAPAEVAVLQLASDENPAIVADAVQILGRRRSHSAMQVLIKMTKHENDNVAVGAIEALGRLGGRAAVEALIETVNSGNFFRTFPAIDVLGRSGDPRAVDPLSRLLSKPSYLPEAARALGRSGERGAVKPLIGLLKNPSDSVVRVASVSLWDLRDRYEEKVGGDTTVIDQLIRQLAGSEAIRRLIRVMPAADVPEAVAVCKLLGVIGSAEAAPVLASALDSVGAVASCAAEALKKIGKDADEPLLQAIREGTSERRRVLLPVVTRKSAAHDVELCLADSDAEVRALACDTLARLGNTSVVSRIFNLLSDPNLRVVHSATAAIQALGSRESRQLAVQASKSQNPVIRRSALRILSYFGDDSAVQPMLEGLKDVDPRVREAAIQGLPYLEDPCALEALFEASKSAIARTRALAARSLGQVAKGNERVYSVLLKGLTDVDAWVRYYSCQSLGRLTYNPASADIAQLLSDEAGQVRVAAVEALSHLESAEAHEILRQASASEDIEVRRAALVGLGIAHRSEDLPVILSAVSAADVPTRLMALSAMVSFPSPLVLGALSTAASDIDEQVSSTAIGFLAGRPEQEATEVLIELLLKEPTRDRAKQALLNPSEGRVAGLLVGLESADDELAAHLISILSRLQRPEARSALLAAMKLNNAAARKAAAAGLAVRRDPEMTLVLQEAADNDPDQEVREICSLLLRE